MTEPKPEPPICAKMAELADRCEQAAAPDRELDTDIFEAVDDLADWCKGPQGWHSFLPVRPDDVGALQTERAYLTAHAPKYTASLDAAVTLVPKGERCALTVVLLDAISDNYQDDWIAALPRHVCAAALRARGQP